ncbi:MAG: hypothetical protein M0026_12415 [Nocardiopsaceae bacterium]|nr:hypothetical protein [Nocardiopsaceae bacterium]
MTTPLRYRRARVRHDRDRVTVTFSRRDLQAAGIELDDCVDFETTEAGDITIRPHHKPRRSITEFVGILDGPDIDVQSLRDEWDERDRALEEQWKAAE